MMNADPETREELSESMVHGSPSVWRTSDSWRGVDDDRMWQFKAATSRSRSINARVHSAIDEASGKAHRTFAADRDSTGRTGNR